MKTAGYKTHYLTYIRIYEITKCLYCNKLKSITQVEDENEHEEIEKKTENTEKCTQQRIYDRGIAR